MNVTPSTVGFLLQGSSTSSTSSTLALLSKGRTSTGSVAQRDPIAALKDAEKNRTKQVAAKLLEPTVQREISEFTRAVVKAGTVDELFRNPRAMRVLLAANGLEDFVGSPGIVSKALKSDPDDPDSTAVKLASTNGNWLETAKTYQFSSRGLAVLKQSSTIKAVAQAYAEVRWRDSLDASAPGVAAALDFKDAAASITSPFQILGNAVYRQVVTTALGLPAQIAFQPLSTQARAITSRLDMDKLKEPAFVDAVVKRFLINLNGGSSSAGVTA